MAALPGGMLGRTRAGLLAGKSSLCLEKVTRKFSTACAQPPSQGHWVSLGPRAVETSPRREGDGHFRTLGRREPCLGGAAPARPQMTAPVSGGGVDPPRLQLTPDTHLSGEGGSPLAEAMGTPGWRDSCCPVCGEGDGPGLQFERHGC